MIQLVAARPLKHRVIRVQGRADGQTFIASGRLNVGSTKWSLFKQLSVGHTIESTSAGHCEIVERRTFVQPIEQVKEYLLEAMLQGKRQVHVAQRDLGVRLARIAEQLLHAVGEMAREAHGAV